MRRRTFFKSIGSNLALMLVPKWWRPALTASPAAQNTSLQDLAMVVLPQSLGAKRIAEVATAFEAWASQYPAGADAGYGYGDPRPAVLGPNPSLRYSDQIKALDVSAAAANGSFAAAEMQVKRAIVQAALVNAGVTSIPSRPNGKHVATDLMAYFYSSSDGKDFCYNVAIRESDCRGLESSGARPPELSYKEPDK
jgi:hypothetical protein